MINTAVVGLGSNIEAQQNIAKAKKTLGGKFSVVQESKFVKTKPIGGKKQDDFLNGAVLIETHLDAYELRACLKHLEVELGRSKGSDPFEPRVIDLDLVVFNGKVLDSDFYDRDFLKQATLELIPDLKY